MTPNRETRSVEVTRAPGGRLMVVLDDGFEPDEVLAALAEVADEAPAQPPAEPGSPVRASSRPYPGEFLG